MVEKGKKFENKAVSSGWISFATVRMHRELPGSLVVRTWGCCCCDPASITGGGTKILQLMWHRENKIKKKKKKKEMGMHRMGLKDHSLYRNKKKLNKNINAFPITLLIQLSEPNTSSKVHMRRKKV